VAFQKSDLFFICVLRPLSNDIKIDETEIQAAKVRRTRRLFSVGSPSKQVSIYDLLNSEHGLQWMPLPEWMEQPFIQDDHMFSKISDICMKRLRTPEALLRADGAPRGIQVRRRDVHLVLHNVAVVEPA